MYIVTHVINILLNFHSERLTDVAGTTGWAEDRSYTVVDNIEEARTRERDTADDRRLNTAPGRCNSHCES